MPQIIIDLDNREDIILSYFAKKNRMTKEEYSNNIIRGWISGQIIGYYQKKFNKKTILELVQIFGEPELL